MSEALQALYGGDVERAHELLHADGELTLFEAAAFGRVDRLRALLVEDPAQVNALGSDGFTALHLSVFAGQEEAVRVLIEQGADLNILSAGSIARVPPLSTAAFVRSVSLARVLLNAGADPNGQGEGGFTALDTATQNKDEEFVQLLLDHGAIRA